MGTPDRQTIAKLIDEAFIFRTLEAHIRARLKELARVRALAAKEVLIHEDDEGKEMFIIASGQVEVSQIGPDGDVTLATLGHGAVIGEVAVITGARRTSTVVALEDTVAIGFSFETIHDLIELHPKVGTLLHKLIEGRAKQAVSKRM